MTSEEYAKKHFAIKKGEEPKSKYIDNLNAVKVKLIDFPDYERLKKVFVNMSEASWHEDYYEQATEEDKNRVIDELLNGRILGQALEAVQFTFLVSGVDLNSSHAIVRNRIGISYIQQSGATHDMRHYDVLLPRAFTKHKNLLDRYKRWCYLGKQLYGDMLDTGDISITDARMSLPRTIPVWLYVSCNLMTLLAIYRKRSDQQEEYPNLNEMVKQMRDLVVEKFPYMKDYFVSACDLKTCLHCKKGYSANCVFKRDEKHQSPDGKENWTLHDKTKKELMLDCELYETEYYIGPVKVSKGEFEK